MFVLICKCVSENLVILFYSKRGQFTIVPVLVGSLSSDKEQNFGRLFGRYLTDPENFFVISSDFCHWGEYCKKKKKNGAPKIITIFVQTIEKFALQ